MSKFIDLKQEAFEANMQLPKLGLVIFTFGNASSVDRTLGVFAIKPSGLPYELLSPDKMVIVDFNGKVVEGTLRPSSDTKTHAVLYSNWENIGGIVHTHSVYSTSWAQSLQDILIYGTTHADHLTSDIPCTQPMTDEMILGDYEYQTGIQIINCFKARGLNYQDTEMILVGNHGPFTWGKTANNAVYNSAILEQLSQMACITKMINKETSRIKDTLIHKHYKRKHGIDSYYGQTPDFKDRY
jgi:L-ribulose-5-phosphate 4-epimerase